MTPLSFLRHVTRLYGDHWQRPFQTLLIKHGYPVTRQTLYNWKTGKTPVPEYVKAILRNTSNPRNSTP